MSDSRAKELIGYSFLVVFANDDTIDEDELAMLERLALADNVVDDEERKVLQQVFDRVDKQKVLEKVSEEIDSFRRRHNI